jgi:ABC-type branched-subunit amino acid transport system ATPase component
MTQPMLVLENLTKRFRGLVAANAVSLAVQERSICSLIGPNGAGKSTLFNLITGYLSPSEGRVLFCGRRIDGMSTTRIAQSGIARAFQIARPFPELTVRDNVRIGALFGRAGPRDVSNVTEDALAVSGLSEVAARLAGKLSVGLMRRLELARAIAARPILLLADEPCAGLNPAETEEIVGILRTIRAGGMTVLLVEHDMQAVMSVSDLIFVLDAGNKIAQGSPVEVSRDPRVISVYLGTPELAA